MAMTQDQLNQAKAQIAAAKVAAITPLLTELTGTSGTTLKGLVATALAAADTTDAVYQDLQSVSNILNLTPNNITRKLAPLQALAATATS